MIIIAISFIIMVSGSIHFREWYKRNFGMLLTSFRASIARIFQRWWHHLGNPFSCIRSTAQFIVWIFQFHCAFLNLNLPECLHLENRALLCSKIIPAYMARIWSTMKYRRLFQRTFNVIWHLRKRFEEPCHLNNTLQTEQWIRNIDSPRILGSELVYSWFSIDVAVCL